MNEHEEYPVRQAEPQIADPAPHATPPPQPVTIKTVVAISVISALIVGALGGFAGGFGGAWLVTYFRFANPADGTIRVIAGETDEPAAAAAAAAVPAVVNIDVVGNLGDTDGSLPEGHPQTPARGNGSGVAFLQPEEGGTLILTNAHVVDGATQIVVTGIDREKHTGTVVGADAETDIAVVRIDAKLPVIEVGDSGALAVGQLVVAIGSPFGLTHSVSSGVISAVGRSITQPLTEQRGVYPLVDVIQTDAAINPGNSGGALVDRQGRLIGINTAIFTGSGANDGIGFAVPIDTAARIADQLIESGSVQHPFLGIMGRGIDQELVASENLSVDEGAFVVDVTKNTEAEKSGIRAGDVIVQLNDEVIRSMDDLILQVRRHRVGDTVTVTLHRGDKQLQIEMKVGIKPTNLEMPPEVPQRPDTP